MSDVKLFHHGRFAVAGGTLPDAVTAYRTFGDPQNPCIVFTVCFGGRIDDKGPAGQSWLIGEGLVSHGLSHYGCALHLLCGQPLDPTKYFIVTVALFGNGEVRDSINLKPFSKYS